MSGISFLAVKLLIRDYMALRMVCGLLTYPLYFVLQSEPIVPFYVTNPGSGLFCGACLND